MNEQPAPTHHVGVPSIQDAVIADMEKRKEIGLERYGTLLQPFNGRDMLRDAYEEALDLATYLRGAIEERDNRPVSALTIYQVLDAVGTYSRLDSGIVTNVEWEDLRTHVLSVLGFKEEKKGDSNAS